MECGALNRYAHAYYVTEEQKARVDAVSGYFTSISKHIEGLHEVRSNLLLLKDNGCVVVNEKMELWPSDEDKRFADGFIPDEGLKIAVALVGSQPKRSWPAKNYAGVFRKIIDNISPNNVHFVLLGGSDAESAAAEVIDSVGNKVVDLVGKTTLNQAAAVVSKCDFYIGSDTGLMHMASAYGLPIIEISASPKDSSDYMGSSPKRTGPWMVKSIVLQPNNLLKGCAVFCSMPYPHCICQISEDEVYSAVLKLMKEI